MRSSDIIEIIASPEVQAQRDRLYQLGAPVGKYQQEAIMELQGFASAGKDEAIAFIASCLFDKVKEHEARRQPKARISRIIKWLLSIVGK